MWSHVGAVLDLKLHLQAQPLAHELLIAVALLTFTYVNAVLVCGRLISRTKADSSFALRSLLISTSYNIFMKIK